MVENSGIHSNVVFLINFLLVVHYQIVDVYFTHPPVLFINF